MSETYAIDTSVAVPLLQSAHTAHRMVRNWATDKDLCLSGHAAFETYSVLTRLPYDLAVAPPDVLRLFEAWFLPAVFLDSTSQAQALPELVAAGVSGGSVYDGLVGLAAVKHGLTLATRDARAASTYQHLGVDFTTINQP